MSDPQWKTAVSTHVNHEPYLRGYRLLDLVGTHSFNQVAYLALAGELPTPEQAHMLDAIFVAVVDHGIAVPSIMANRAVVSGGNPLHIGVAAGVLTFGEAHGGAIESAARIMQVAAQQDAPVTTLAQEIVTQARARKERLPGYGHRYYKVEDPRTPHLLEIAKSNGFYGRHCQLAEALADELNAQTGRPLVLNVDGVIAAIISDMGFDWRMGKGFFIIGRTVGLVAHAFEEISRERPFRQLPGADIVYDGEPPRPVS